LSETSNIPQQHRRSIEDFRGDFEELAVLMRDSWAENKSQPLLYTAEFLSSFFSYPGASFHNSPTLYEDSKPAAFIGGFPRRLKWKGRDLRILALSFLTVITEYKNGGYGIVLWNEALKRARAAGFDGVINYCVQGEPMDNMMLAYFQRMKLPSTRLLSIRHLTRVIPPKQTKTGREKVDSEFIENFLIKARSAAESVPLARIWSREEAEWQCQNRTNAIVASYTSGERQGLLTGYIMQIADRANTKCLLIEDVLWQDLLAEERRALVQKLVDSAASEGARLCVVPLLGYADSEPFIKARFLQSARVLNAYFTLWNGAPTPEPVTSFYLDVF